MSICTNPNAILPISINECIGTSLNYINSYFELIKDETCLQQEEIEEITATTSSLSSAFISLSSNINGFPKAHVTFSGRLSTNTGTLVMFHQHNVEEVHVTGKGEYNIILNPEIVPTLTPSFSGYGVLATCTQLLTSGQYVFASTKTTSPTAAGIKILNKNGDPGTPDLVAVSIFFNK